MAAAPTTADYRLGFTTQERERPDTPLPVEGTLPPWLEGTLIRNGPAKFEAGTERYRHWFDGLAMLHRFALQGGAVTYANRFLDTPAYRAARTDGRIGYAEFATDPCRSLFKRVASAFSPPAFGDNANVNVMRWDERFVAMTETPIPVLFDAETLESAGVGAPAPGQLTVAHPHVAPRTGELVSYATQLGPRSSYRVFAQAPGQPRRTIASLPVSRPAYMHSFAVTERYLVLVEFPYVVVPAAIVLSGRPFIDNFRWKPERGTRVQVVDLETGALQGSYEGEACFAFHHVNAFERDGELVIDLCAYADAEIVQSFFLDRIRAPGATVPDSHLRRLRVPLGGSGGDVTSERLSDVGPELPRIDYRRRNGRPYRVVYGAAPTEPGAFLGRIVKVDVESGETKDWSQDGTFPGEPVFVPSPDGTEEDDGVLLSVVLDPARETSFLLVLDAATLDERARAYAPQHIPFGFHGQFFAG